MTSVINKNLYGHAAAIVIDTPHADGEADAVYVGAAGNVQVILPDNSQVAFLAVPAGTILPVRSIRIEATGTTASDLVALYTRR